MRAASLYAGGHTDDADYVSWNPTHPELFCTSSQKDRRIVFWDARRELYSTHIALINRKRMLRKPLHATISSQSLANSDKLLSRRKGCPLHIERSPNVFLNFRQTWRKREGVLALLRQGRG